MGQESTVNQVQSLTQAFYFTVTDGIEDLVDQ